MRHPLWAVNSILVLVCIAVLIFIFFSRPERPTWTALTLESSVLPIRQQASEINIRQVYENDLFGTYEKALTEEAHKKEFSPLPQPPEPKHTAIPEEPKPTFLQPLNIALKGILYIIHDDSKNRACIVELKTKQERNYKVGDFIEDAQLIKIFNKKVILLRANGQQEVLYLRAMDAEQDPIYAVIDGWDRVVQPLAEGRFIISIEEFSHRIKSLAQFIDALDLTTAYRNGVSIGCRIGQVKDGSLAHYLGLRSGDIIPAVNGMTISDTNSRFEVYKKIMALQGETTIAVVVIRQGTSFSMYYTLSNFIGSSVELQQSQEKILYEQKIAKEKMSSLQERHKFAPTVKQINEKERENMQRTNSSTSKKLTSLLAR